MNYKVKPIISLQANPHLGTDLGKGLLKSVWLSLRKDEVKAEEQESLH